MNTAHNPLIVALDTGDLGLLRALAAAVAPHAGLLKIGLQAYTALGPAAVTAAAEHAPVFLDLKLHDIPTTVAGAAAAAADLGVAMLTVHTAGGAAMVAAAAKAAPDVRILGVTVLTSVDDETLSSVGQPAAAAQVERLAGLALGAGAGGLVCAATDLRALRAVVGEDVAVVTPGIRPAGVATHDQKRVTTPAAAMAAGATWIVLGRAITGAEDPAAAAAAVHAAVSGAAAEH